MRLRSAALSGYRSVDYLEFDIGAFTVLFGKNNSGKTNILEALYGTLAPEELNSHRQGHVPPRGLRGPEFGIPPFGALIVDMDPELPYDSEVLALKSGYISTEADATPLPANQVAFLATPSGGSAVTFADPREDFRNAATREFEPGAFTRIGEGSQDASEAPIPRAVFLDWEIDDFDERVGAKLLDIFARTETERSFSNPDPAMVLSLLMGQTVPAEILESIGDESSAWHVRDAVTEHLDYFSHMATLFLPDFIDGTIHAELQMPRRWGETLNVRVSLRPAHFDPNSSDRASSIGELGRGTSRWIAVAVQTALHILEPSEHDRFMAEAEDKPWTGHLLLLDEPEAHLHPHAVASVVRWCHKMVEIGFNVVAATHHEEFLRTAGDEVTFVQVSRGDNENAPTHARTLVSTATPLLQELGHETGMHPAVALSLHRAILFVEGPLDQAMLEEYAGPRIDAAGIMVIPIHGTKNLEGLIDGEFPSKLGIKVGILTDATVTATMWDRSNNRRSSEEIKLVRLVRRFEESGSPPPHIFGVAEADLLFTLPDKAIRDHLSNDFSSWADLVKQCREASGLSASHSVDWKTYAKENFGLELTTPAGVRTIVQKLDLAGVELPSLHTVVEEIIVWAL